MACRRGGGLTLAFASSAARSSVCRIGGNSVIGWGWVVWVVLGNMGAGTGTAVSVLEAEGGGACSGGCSRNSFSVLLCANVLV